jgi:polysaccharide biosynthesis transport protein
MLVPATDKSSSGRQRHQSSSFDLSSLWFAFRRRWFLILFFGASLSAGAGYAVWRLLPPPKAQAYVVYEISADTPAVLSQLPDPRDFLAFKQFQSNLVTKRSVLSAILNEPGVGAIKECSQAMDQHRWLEQMLKVDFKMGKEYMRITAELEKEADALALIKATHESYFYEAVGKEQRRKEETLAKLSLLQSQRADELKKEMAKLRELSEKGGAPSDKVAALQQEFVQQRINAALQDKLKLESEIRQLEVNYVGRDADVKALAKSEPPEHLVQAELDANADLKAHKAYLADLEQRLKNYSAQLQPGVRPQGLLTLEKQVEDQKVLVAQLPKSLRAAAVDAARSKHFIATDSRKESLKSQLETAKVLWKKLDDDIATLIKSSKSLNSTQQDFDQARMQITQLAKLTETLSGTVEKMKIERDAPSRVSQFQEPTAFTPDDVSRRLKFALMGLMGGLLVGALPLWGWELRKRIFHEEEQLTEAVSIPLIGSIPHIARKRRSHAKNAVVAQPRMRAMITESIDSARATVLFKLQESGGRSVMVTSSVAGEAKSSVSGHLAISLARAGFRTLIIDSDMRRPTLHRVFGVQKGPGFSDVLLGRAELGLAVQESQLQNLFVLPAGDWMPAASASLANGAWTELLKDAKEQFDVVVVDSPPVLLVADALTMARDVDAVLLSTLKDVSEIDLVMRSIHKLESVGVSPLGMIASGINHRMYSSRYYDRYASSYAQRARG